MSSKLDFSRRGVLEILSFKVGSLCISFHGMDLKFIYSSVAIKRSLSQLKKRLAAFTTGNSNLFAYSPFLVYGLITFVSLMSLWNVLSRDMVFRSVRHFDHMDCNSSFGAVTLLAATPRCSSLILRAESDPWSFGFSEARNSNDAASS